MILAFQVVEGGQRVRVFGMRLAKLHHVMSDVCRRPFVAMPSRKFRRLDDGGEGGSECAWRPRSEEHTSELQSLMRISYAVFCLKKNKNIYYRTPTNNTYGNTKVNHTLQIIDAHY